MQTERAQLFTCGDWQLQYLIFEKPQNFENPLPFGDPPQKNKIVTHLWGPSNILGATTLKGYLNIKNDVAQHDKAILMWKECTDWLHNLLKYCITNFQVCKNWFAKCEFTGFHVTPHPDDMFSCTQR